MDIDVACRLPGAALDGAVMIDVVSAGFPKAARLLKTDEFSSVFRLRPWARSPHFVMYGRRTGAPARLGLVVGKKFAPRSVSRNLIRRLARETFRLRRAELAGWDVLLRLHLKFDRKALPGAASPALKAMCRDEIKGLIDTAVRELPRRSREAQAAAKMPARAPAGPPPAEPCAGYSPGRSPDRPSGDSSGHASGHASSTASESKS
jgi:ribonuclease P protein component